MAPNITFGGSSGNPPLDANWGSKYGGMNTTYSPRFAGGGRSALAGGSWLSQFGLDTVTDNLKKRVGPYGTALKETLLEGSQKAGANLPGTIGKTQGVLKSTVQGIAPKAYSRAAAASSAAGTKAAMDIMRQGGGAYAAQRAAQVAGIKAGGKIAGKYLTNRVPYLGAGISLASGDPFGAAGTRAGGAIGSIIAPGVGTVIAEPICTMNTSALAGTPAQKLIVSASANTNPSKPDLLVPVLAFWITPLILTIS